jgi:type VI secretion system protein ImpC
MNCKDITDILPIDLGPQPQSSLIKSTRSRTDLTNVIEHIDKLLSKYIDRIIHTPEFLQLESTWLGIHRLIKTSQSNINIRISVLQLTKGEARELAIDNTINNSDHLYNIIYNQEFNMPGGQPYSLLICDYFFSHHEPDISILRYLAKVGETSLCPVITATSPQTLKLDRWYQLNHTYSLREVTQSESHIAWNQLREEAATKYLFLTAPCFLGRTTYKKNDESYKFSHNETISSQADYCWINAAFAQADCILKAFIQHGWCTAIRGRENGGIITNLPLTNSLKATEIALSDTQEKAMSDLGIVPLCHYKNTNFAVIFACNSLYKPSQYDTIEATQNAAISARLPYILAVSRFAHFLKIIARDKIGSFISKDNLEAWLNRWISQYVNANAESKELLKAKFPLAEARVSIMETEDNPGSYEAIIHLKPWLQLEELSASLRLVTQLPKQRG